jgi:hypothetical protein
MHSSNEYQDRKKVLDKQVPFLTEDQLIARGALYKKALTAWESFVIQENRLITGQSSFSSASS